MLPVLFVVFYIVTSGFFYSNACNLSHCPLREQTAFRAKAYHLNRHGSIRKEKTLQKLSETVW